MSGKKGRKIIRAGSHVHLPDGSGVGIVRQIDQRTPGWRVLVASGDPEVLEWFPHTSLKPTGYRFRKLAEPANG